MYQRLAMPRPNPCYSYRLYAGCRRQNDSSVVTSQAMTWSVTRKKTLTSATKISTMIEEMTVSLRVGQVILETSVRTCWKNVTGFVSAIATASATWIEANVKQPRESSRG